MNPNSLIKLEGFVEASLKDTKPLDRFQFIRNGYYVTDKDSTKDKLVFNRTCGLKSSFKLSPICNIFSAGTFSSSIT